MFSTKIKFERKNFLLNVNLTLHAGLIKALVGPSGSGKTCLMRMMSGLEKPDTGIISSGSKILFHAENNVFVPPQQRKVGFMFQDYALFNHLTLTENIGYGVEKNQRKHTVCYWLQRINLSHRGNDYPQSLSGGEKQRVALARTLACKPEVLLLDEPFSALDTVLRHELRREIQSLIEDSGIPVLIATHDLEEARLIADQISVMASGHIIRDGDIGDVFRHPGSVAAASALGWQNILHVVRTQGSTVYGSWGQLNVQSKIQPDVLALGFPDDCIELDCEGGGIRAEITHLVDVNDVQIIEVMLADQSFLMFEQKKLKEKLKVKQIIGLKFDNSLIKLFYC